MLNIICAALFSAVGAPAVVPSAPLAVTKQRPLVGGYRAIATDDADAQAAAAFAAASVEGEVAEISSAERQVVQGTNFRLQFTTSDGRAYAAVVYRALNGTWRVTSIDEVGDHHGEDAEAESEA